MDTVPTSPTINPPPPQPTSSVDIVQTAPVAPQPRKSFPKWILFVFLFVLLILGGGMYVMQQNQKQIAKVTPTPSPKPSPTAIPDLYTETNRSTTMNWRTYENKEGGYSFQYPPTLSIIENPILNPKDVYFANTYDKSTAINEIRVSTIISTGDQFCGVTCTTMTASEFYNSSNSLWKTGHVGGGGPGINVEKVTDATLGGKQAKIKVSHPNATYEAVNTHITSIEYYVFLGNPTNDIMIFSLTYNNQNKTYATAIDQFDQMISTFKFLNQPQEKACTQEAKLCPDGSGVGRSGPNCEFAKCPGE